MHTGEIRSAFLEFFRKNDHEILPSGSLVPHNDPTLMFTNAGMVPFKNVFSGAEKLTNAEDAIIKRAATSQKCVRAGGKHNDLDNVGYTARHHTFFEMLGNFSFGDYFKEGAINFAWDLLVKTFEISPEKLLITIYHDDDEAFAIWKKVTGFSDSKIIRIATSDNFWAMGDTGPCGPCSEIFYDHGEKIKGGPPGSEDADGDRFIEIWNLVFMQYEQLAGEAGEKGKRINLPKPCIDTGMGLERMAALLQGLHDNYDIDLFKRLISASEEISGSGGKKNRISHRVITDHLRACSFLIADGVLPANEGRGYVLRRIMRRAMRHAHMLGCRDPLMHRLVPALISEMGQAYPELIRAEASITETLKQEEEKFRETLDKGLKLLEGETKSLKKGGKLKGETAFRLYDTYGFPIDLTEDILRARGISVEHESFNAAMEEQKKRARAAWAGSGEEASENIWFGLREETGATEFLGYETLKASGKISAIIKNGKKLDKAIKGDEVAIITNQTPFYAESGGQAGDVGTLKGENSIVTVSTTKKYLGDLHVHIGRVIEGEIKAGDIVLMKVEKKRRQSLRANHSATHLLHAVLRKYLGEHVTQKGSLVEDYGFRFDFSHGKALSEKDIEYIEHEVNRLIRQNSKVETRIMSIEEAMESGAMALFGEKYGDEVRVLTMGEEAGKNYSTELCGGTHVRRTGDIGLFKITKEYSVSSGVRRIEAVTAEEAEKYSKIFETRLRNVASALKTSPEEVEQRIEALLEERKKIEKELSEVRKKVAMGGITANEKEEDLEKIAGINFVGRILEGVPAKDLHSLADDFKKKIGSGIVVLVAVSEGKAAIVAGVTSDLVGKINAIELVRVGSVAIGGKGGGGRPDFAQAGGPDGVKAKDAIEAIKKLIA